MRAASQRSVWVKRRLAVPTARAADECCRAWASYLDHKSKRSDERPAPSNWSSCDSANFGCES
eukprot:CAMPEP_0204221556 /NCGR_PEP_ID=MMETSP0361-20130328/81674_1 /ASSEMBLY_ACC=CAM_ASM_000343 /TAXON_ID=268821 /ORGANISM="Scrippsiella Hangoei, Strain SHTV-5" /LENGTH=62 /DNA_ID=CAMNT_0051187057 /DNA_START=10 /DNA_END=198 /DNA_ORIENTATION=-